MTTLDETPAKKEGEPRPPRRRASDATGQAVASGYAAVAQNIAQARIAAEKFRQGGYNVSAIPGDLATMSGRMPQVIKDFSSAGIEILQLLFDATGSSGAAVAGGPVNLRVDFVDDDDKRASSLTDELARPDKDVGPDAIICDGLTKRGAATQIGKVTFTCDLSTGELVAAVKITDDLVGGVYSGLVYAKDQDTPLGTLSVRVDPPKTKVQDAPIAVANAQNAEVSPQNGEVKDSPT
jgi:hypothetical protein